MREAQIDIRRCLAAGATVQIDFTEGRLCIKLDPSKKLLDAFVDLNNRVLAAFTAEEKKKIGIHTCPGGDQDSTHSADVDYAELLPALFRVDVGNFFVQLASEADRPRVLKILGAHAKGDRRGLRRRHGPDLAARRDARRSPRPDPRGGEVHRPGAPRLDRRLRLLAVRRRHLDLARHRVRQDPGTRRGQRHGVAGAGV